MGRRKYERRIDLGLAGLCKGHLTWIDDVLLWKYIFKAIDYNMRGGGQRLMTKGKVYQDGMHMTKFVKDITKWCALMINLFDEGKSKGA